MLSLTSSHAARTLSLQFMLIATKPNLAARRTEVRMGWACFVDHAFAQDTSGYLALEGSKRNPTIPGGLPTA